MICFSSVFGFSFSFEIKFKKKSVVNHDVLDYFYSSSSPSSSSDLNQPSSLTKLALNSFLGILISSPLIAKEIVPVSSGLQLLMNQ